MQKNHVALYGGSFDPITSGHFQIALRASELFDEVWVVAFINPDKHGLFSRSERAMLLQKTFADYPAIHTDVSDRMLVDYAEQIGAGYLVRGIRNGADAEEEITLSRIYRALSPDLETILLPSSAAFDHVSSTFVRELLRYGKDLGDSVPESSAELLMELYRGITANTADSKRR